MYITLGELFDLGVLDNRGYTVIYLSVVTLQFKLQWRTTILQRTNGGAHYSEVMHMCICVHDHYILSTQNKVPPFNIVQNHAVNLYYCDKALKGNSVTLLECTSS